MKKIFLILVWVVSLSSSAQANLSVDLDTIVVTNSRIEQKDYKVASNVTVITREQIAASNAHNISDVLRSAQGVNVYDNSTNKTAVIDIRGFGETAALNVLVLINGRKINSIDISGPDLEQIPLGSVERIEIIHGAGSVLYGDNAVGGVVNIITKKGEGDLQGKVGFVHSSYNSWGEHGEISGAHKDFSYYLYSKYMDQHGYRENSDELAKDFNTRLGYNVSKNLTTDLEVGWHKDDTGIPSGLSGANLAALGRRASTTPHDYTSTKDRYVKLSLDAKPLFEDVYIGSVTADLLYRNRDTFGSLHYVDSDNNPQTSDTKRSIDTYGITGKYAFDHLVFDKEVNFVTGIDYYDHTNDIRGSGVGNSTDITIKKKEFGVYEFFQYELLNKVFVSTGTRYNLAQYDFKQRDIIVDQSRTPTKLVNSGGLKYEYARGSNLHFSWQQTFRFLATDEWYSTFTFPPGLNLNLKQQSGEQYEIGVKHNFNDTVILGITPYWIVNKNELYLDPLSFENKNYDKTSRNGIEFDQRVDLLKFVDLGFLKKLESITSYTYQDARFDKGPNNGKFIPLVPMHQATETISAQFLESYHLSLTERFVGSRYAISDLQNSTAPIKPYEVLDAKVAYKRKNYEIYAAANNILDMRYYTYVAKSGFSANKSYFPALERNFSMGVDIKF